MKPSGRGRGRRGRSHRFLSWSALCFRGRIKLRVDIPGDEVDTALLESGPTGLLDVGSSLGELVGRDLASPVGLDGLLHLTVGT